MNAIQKESGLQSKITGVSITGYDGQKGFKVNSFVAVEEPLEIFINNNLFYTTMRSPGDERLLAVGYCFTRGIIHSIDDFLGIAYCKEENANRIDIVLPSSYNDTGNAVEPSASHITVSSCGICGTDIIRLLCSKIPPKDTTLTIESSRIVHLYEILESRQNIFPVTGGAHAAGVFGRLGNLMTFSEDVGRHNALDKAVGSLVTERKLEEPCIVALTSRLSYEMVQKAARINAEIVIGISSPTSLAVELARSVNITLIGFSRREKGSIYTCPERVILMKQS
jgi:FdhD protein